MKKLEVYSVEMTKLQAKEDLRQFLILDRIHPARSNQELQYRRDYIEELQKKINEGLDSEDGPVLKSMPVKDAATLSMLGGFGAVVKGPPIKHGIGTRKPGFRNGST